MAVVDPTFPYKIEFCKELFPKPGQDFTEVLADAVVKEAGVTGPIVVVMECWPDSSPMHDGFYQQCLKAVNALNPTKFVQVKPVEWKNAAFIKKKSAIPLTTLTPVAFAHLMESTHVQDAAQMARWQAYRTETNREA